jgi:hypothetical protein
MKNGEWGMGDGEWEERVLGDGEWVMGANEFAIRPLPPILPMKNGEWGMGDGEWLRAVRAGMGFALG